MILSPERKTIFYEVYDKYSDILYRIALSHLQNREDAEDVVQDVFVKYMGTADRFEDESHEKAWLIRVTINRCHDFFRRNRVREYVPLENAETISSDENIEKSLELSELLTTLRKIPEKYKTVIVLHYLEGFSVEEISKTLKLSVSAVKMRLLRGREILKNNI